MPNFGRGGQWKSDDRSEPPVGAITVLGLYEKFKDKWLLRDSFDRLLAWNRWWAAHRDVDGYLVWGSDTHDSPECHDDASCGTLQGARFESGLDNSPMYDDAPFDKKTERMMLADVGLMGMYVADCDALGDDCYGAWQDCGGCGVDARERSIAKSWRRCGMRSRASFLTRI